MPRDRWGALAVLVVVTALLPACGSSPSAPSGQAPNPSDQVLRITFLAPCSPPDGNVLSLFPAVYARVKVTGGTSEWVAKADTARAGDVELRVQAVEAGPSGSLRLAGTIKGVAKHMPEILPNLPAWQVMVDFGTGGAAVTGFALGSQSTTLNAGMDGSGTGDITLSNGSASCRGTTFSWTLAPPP